MISKISAQSPNFSGNVRIGENKAERTQIAKDILNIPEENRGYFLESINATKAILAARTPEDVNLMIHVRKSDDEEGLYRGVSVHVTDSKSNIDSIVGKRINLDYIFGGEENGYFGVDVKDKLAELRESVLNDVAPADVQKHAEDAPKNIKQVLDRLA